MKLIDVPDYPVEAHNIPASSWRYVDTINEIVIDELDPQVTATFLLFFDGPPASGDEPQLLCSGVLVGKRSEWLWTLQFGGIHLLMLLTVAAVGLAGYMMFSIYQDHYSAEAYMRRDYFNRYWAMHGNRACQAVTLRADRGEVHEGELGRNMTGLAGALVLNRSSSIDELLKRKVVFICVELEAKHFNP